MSEKRGAENTRFFLSKKVVYKKVYIDWPKIKKVLIYNIQYPKKVHQNVP